MESQSPTPQAARSGPQLYGASPLLDSYRKDLPGLDQTRQVIASLLFDICLIFTLGESDRMFSRILAEELNLRFSDRPWAEARKGQPIDGLWLAKQLRPYGIRPRTIWIGEDQAKGYHLEDFSEAFQRYVPKAEAQAYLAELTKPDEPENGVPRRSESELPPTPSPANPNA